MIEGWNFNQGEVITIQELRDNGEIEFSQPSKKVILYNIDSIREYLNRHARKTF